MAENVEYELNLKDNFSKPLEDAKHSAEGFHESVLHIVEALGLVEAAHEAFDFLKESLSEFDRHQVVLAGLTQMYNNNSESVSVNISELKELAEAQEKLTGVRSEDTMQAEQNLLKFREIRISYEELIPVISDFAKATGDTAAGAAQMLGRSLENPEHAMRLLIQAGVSPMAIQTIENLQKMGHVAQAQQHIFDAIKEKYQGVAKAMFDASPAEQMAIKVKELKEDFGQMEESIVRRLMPAINTFFDYLHETIAFLRQHKEAIKEIITVVEILTAGFIVYKIVLISIAIWEGKTAVQMAIKNTVMLLSEAYAMALAEGYSALSAAQWALNVAMDANPIGAVIVALTALTVVVYEAYKHWDQLKESFTTGMEHFKFLAFVIYDSVVYPIETAIYTVKMFWDELTGNSAAVSVDRFNIYLLQVKSAVDRLNYYKSLLKIQNQNDNFFSAHAENKEGKEGKTGKAGLPADIMVPKSQAVAGTSHVTINVTIQKMTGIEHFVSTTVKGAQAAGENIEKMMIAAINQFQASVDT